MAAARLNECEVQYQGFKTAQGFSFRGVGPDPTVAAEIYKYLAREVVRLSKIMVTGRANISNFQKGAAHELSSRLAELKRERDAAFKATSSGTALVIHKKQLIMEAFGEAKYGNNNSKIRYDSAYMAGREAGRSVNLDDQVSGSRSKELE